MISNISLDKASIPETSPQKQNKLDMKIQKENFLMSPK